jgi:hypothetical protein
MQLIATHQLGLWLVWRWCGVLSGDYLTAYKLCSCNHTDYPACKQKLENFHPPGRCAKKTPLRFFYAKNRGNAVQLNGCCVVFLTDKCKLLTTNLQPLVTTLFQIP